MKELGHFIINTKLPSMNDVINENRKNKFAGANLKKSIEEAIIWFISTAKGKTLEPIKQPCEIHITWHEKTKRRDVDNIQSSQKFILDALQKSGILIKDDRRYVKQVHHNIVNSASDYVVVHLFEWSEGGGND